MKRSVMHKKLTFMLQKYLLIFLIISFFLPTNIISTSKSEVVNENTTPVIINSSIYPKKVRPGDEMIVNISAFDPFGINKVEAKFYHEKGFDFINLEKCYGTMVNGIWKGKWKVHDTIIKEYSTIVTVISKSGRMTSKELKWWDPEEPWYDLEFQYRRQINFTEPQGLSRINTHVLLSIDFEQNRLSNENGIVLVYNGEKIPFDGYAITEENGWVTTLEGLAEINISSGETISCYLYYDPDYSATELLPSTTGWSYVGASGYSGQNYVDLSPVDVDCYGDDLDGQFSQICGSTDHIKLNEWCYFKSPQSGNIYFKTGSDDGSGLWLDGNLIVTDNNGGHGLRWRDSSAQSLVNGRYYAIEIDFAEHTGAQVLYNRWDTSPGDNSNGNIIDVEAFPFYGDEWEIEIDINDNEEIGTPPKPTLILPLNSSSTNDETPFFQWTVGDNAENYTLLVDDEADLTDGDEHINISFNSTTDSYNIQNFESLSGEGVWYWKVIANNSHVTNSSDVWNFIFDITPPLIVNLSSPSNDSSTDSNSVSFSWSSTLDNTTNTSDVSDIDYYNLIIDDDMDFSSPLINDNTINTYLTRTVSGQLYWRVRAVDSAGNNGSFSDTRYLTIFSYTLSADSSTIQIKKGTDGVIILNLSLNFGESENVSLSSTWTGDNIPSGINV